MMHTHSQPRGFTLLIAVILTTVVLSIALSLLDVSYKQIILASSAKQSEFAFYAADSGLECALYQDQKLNAFDIASSSTSGFLNCEGQAVPWTATFGSGSRTTTFSIPCASGVGSQITVTVYKTTSASQSTKIDSEGFSSCIASDANRDERGEKASY